MVHTLTSVIMSSIGPQIPAHLLKQNSLSENHAESSEDEAGPMSMLEKSTSTYIGPQIPVHLTKPTAPTAAAPDEDDDEDDYGPALPPDLKRSGGSSSAVAGPSGRTPSPPAQSRRVLGPSLPGHDRQSYDDSDDDDDGYGPMPLPAGMQRSDGVSAGVREFMEREERRRKEIEVRCKF